jgi:hypothetical protein
VTTNASDNLCEVSIAELPDVLMLGVVPKFDFKGWMDVQILSFSFVAQLTYDICYELLKGKWHLAFSYLLQ